MAITQKMLNGVLVDLTQEERDERVVKSADRAVEVLAVTKTRVAQDIKKEGLSRIAAYFPEMADIDELATIFRAVLPAARSTALMSAKAIYDVATTEVAWANDPARTQAELDAYDPLAAAWP